jgi:hypothetical protein
MKKYILLIGFLCALTYIKAQTHADALRYSQPIIGGTARSIAMGGAFGALGGDFSTLSTNPAGIAVYRGSEFTFSPEFYNATTNARYYSKETKESKFNVNLSNLGYVASFSEDNGILKAVNFGIGFNRIANFHRNSVIAGDNPYTTYADYMVADANANGIEDYYARFTSALFYDAWIIDDTDSPGNYYISPNYLYNDGGFRTTEQNFNSNEWGRINEWAFSLGFNFGDMVYFGGTFGIQPLYYESEKTTEEFDAADRSNQYFNYFESLKVSGTGYTAKIGMIVKPIQVLRLGVAFHLPVTYRLNEQYTTTISSGYTTTPWETLKPVDLNNNILDYLENDYKIITPAKAIGSVGIVLGKLLVLSSDLEYLDYSSMRMRSSEDNYSDQNELIRTVYRDNVNLKIGAEVRLGTLYFRGGGGYYGSPYAVGEDNANANRYSLSCGLGVRDKSYFFDIAYQYTTTEETYFAYQVDIKDNNNITTYKNPANLNLSSGLVTTTIGFRF